MTDRTPADMSAANDLFTTYVHATAALRRRRDVLPILWGSPADDDEKLQVIGDAGQAVLSLHLAAQAARRYCEAHDEPGPLGREQLNELCDIAEHMRDTLMHWEQKGQRDNLTSMHVTAFGLRLTAPDRGEMVAATLSWNALERYASKLERWAAFKVGGVAGFVSKPSSDAPT